MTVLSVLTSCWSLTVVSVTLFTVCSGGAAWGQPVAVLTACWLHTAVRGGVWREGKQLNEHLLVRDLNILMDALFTENKKGYLCLKDWLLNHHTYAQLLHHVGVSDDLHVSSTVFLLYTIPLKHYLHSALFPFILIHYGLELTSALASRFIYTSMQCGLGLTPAQNIDT